jgi:hypothetical protein
VFDYGDEAAFLHRTPTGFVRVRQWWEPVRPSGSSQFAFWNKRVLALTDLDGDGWSDLLLEGQALHRGGPAGFERSPAWTGSIDHALQDVRPAADFDGDGLPELWPSSSVFPTYGVKIYEAGP